MDTIKFTITNGSGGGLTGGAYVTKQLSGSDLWLGFDAKFVGFTSSGTFDFAGYFGGFDDDSPGANNPIWGEGVWIGTDGAAVLGFWDSWSGAAPWDGVPAEDTWYHFDIRYAPGSPITIEVWLDGVDIGLSSSNNLAGPITGVTLGAPWPGGWEINYQSYIRGITVGTTKGGTDVWDGDISAGAAAFDTVFADTGNTVEFILDSNPAPPPLVVGDATPIIIGAQWRFIVTNKDGEVLTLLDRQATNRRVVARLNGPWEASGSVLSESPEINILSPNPWDFVTSQPFLAEGVRLLYGFRREFTPGTTADIWVCRFGGIILNTVDDSDSDPAITNYIAYDPWQYLYKLPVRDPNTGDFPPPEGLLVAANPGSLIAFNFLFAATQIHDVFGTAHIDAGFEFPGFGDPGAGTIFYGGTLEETAELGPLRVQQGKSVGELFDDLCATGTMDIVMRPVYDPRNRPGVCVEMSIYDTAGIDRPGAQFAYDKPGRSVTGINRITDGNQRANILRFYKGQGNRLASELADPTSPDTYGEYWLQQFFPDKPDAGTVADIAQAQLDDLKNGQITITVTPASERSASPLLEYEPGDAVPVFASSNLREALAGNFRVHEIPIDIDDLGIESVSQMLVAMDETGS